MTRALIVASFVFAPTVAFAQSLHLAPGTNGVEVSVGWSVGPSSNGVESHVGVGLQGKADLGVAFNRYTIDTEGGDFTFSEYAPFFRYFALKQQAGKPVSLAVHGQWFVDNYDNDDRYNYVLAGTTVYREVELARNCSMHPFLSFGFVRESYTSPGIGTDTAVYLTRHLGLHFNLKANGGVFRFTLEDNSFRRETYRAARIAYIRGF